MLELAGTVPTEQRAIDVAKVATSVGGVRGIDMDLCVTSEGSSLSSVEDEYSQADAESMLEEQPEIFDRDTDIPFE